MFHISYGTNIHILIIFWHPPLTRQVTSRDKDEIIAKNFQVLQIFTGSSSVHVTERASLSCETFSSLSIQ